METVTLGQTSLQISRIGFGAIPIQRLGDDDAIAVIRRCLELGITFLDTANQYTTSEGRIGRALDGWNGPVVLATKTQSRTAEGVAEHLAQSLRMMRVDSIDLYQLHNVSAFADYEKVMQPGGAYETVMKAVQDGRVKHVGITSHQIDVAKESVKSGRFETVMYPLNFIVHEPGEELLALSDQHGVGFIAMKPFAGGMIDNASLAMKYPVPECNPHTRCRAHSGDRGDHPHRGVAARAHRRGERRDRAAEKGDGQPFLQALRLLSAMYRGDPDLSRAGIPNNGPTNATGECGHRLDRECFGEGRDMHLLRRVRGALPVPASHQGDAVGERR